MIEFHCIDGIEVPELDSELFCLWLKYLVENEGFELGPLNVIYCSDEYLLDMNRTHLDHDYYTDVITFDYTEDRVVSGDAFISYDRVVENASAVDVAIELELLRVTAHGVLHLCGYKDKSLVDSELMRSKEDFYISRYVSRETE
jgi:probable rRNA maturation factor